MPESSFNAWLAKQQQSGGGGTTAPGEKPDGKAIFTGASSCGGCHTLKDAGTSGTTGPDLDKGLKGKSKAYIRESIVDPDKVVTPGYKGGIMPPVAKANGMVILLSICPAGVRHNRRRQASI
jgi:mono/diheme cytochrome c family protein